MPMSQTRIGEAKGEVGNLSFQRHPTGSEQMLSSMRHFDQSRDQLSSSHFYQLYNKHKN